MATLNKQKRDTEFKPYHVQFAEQVIAMLEQRSAPWQKPWKGGELFAPHNEANGNQYRGLNRIMLSYFSDMKYGGDPRYMTLLQANNLGYRVKKGEHGQSVVHWQFTEERPVLDTSGKPVMGEDGAPRKESVRLERPRVRYARVFNATQLERAEDDAPYPAFDPSRAPHFSWDANEKAAALLAASGAVIEHRPGDRACYRPAQDTIVLPEQEQFPDAAGYYGTALHELGHWTGHESRLDRDIRHPFGSAEYAREELRAEIASWMMSQDLGVAHEPGQHAAYVADWIRALKNDPYEIVRAAGDAEKIKEYVMGLELNKEQEQTHQHTRVSRRRLAEQYVHTVSSLHSAYGSLSPEERQRIEKRKENYEQLASEMGFKKGLLKINDLAAQHGAVSKEIQELSTQDAQWWELDHRKDILVQSIYDVMDRIESGQENDHVGINVIVEETGKRETLEMVDFQGHHCERQLINEGNVDGLVRFAQERFCWDEQEMAYHCSQNSVEWWKDFNAIHRELRERVDLLQEKHGIEAVTQAIGNSATGSLGVIPADVHAALDKAFGLRDHKDITLNDFIESYDHELFRAQVGHTDGATVRAMEKQAQEYGWSEYTEQAKQLFIEQMKREDAAEDLEQAQKVNGENRRDFRRFVNSLPARRVKQTVEASPSQAPELPADKNPSPETDKTLPPQKEQEARPETALSKGWNRAQRWISEQLKEVKQGAKQRLWPMNPQEEFATALQEAGLDLRGELPEMDGKLHRVPLADRPHGRDGAYVGYLDGRPAGYVQNFVTGEKMNWTASHHRLSEKQLAELRAEADQRRQQREAERQVLQNQVAKQCAEIFEQRHVAASNHPYLMRKGVLPHGIKESPDGSKLIVPLRNIQGDIRSVQIIHGDGSKFFEKGGQKRGCFHLLGGEEKLKKQGQVLLAEEYATAASLYEATGRPVAACFDAGNLEPVAKALREKYPLLQIIVCADNDVQNEVNASLNVGVAMAERAAAAVQGRVVIPRFTPEEEARGMTDFNDLHQLRGDKAVKEAVLQARQQTKGMER